MWWRRLLTVPAPSWYLLVSVVGYITVSIVLPSSKLVTSQTYAYFIQPCMALALAGVAYYFARGQGDRVRHRSEKALIVGSVVAVWFVAYFSSGIFLTYQHNAVASSWRAIGMNLLAFGVGAVALEYVRHSIMLLGRRRNVVWLGVIVSIVFAASQIGISQLGQAQSMVDIIKLFVSNIIPTGVASFLLTYLSFNAGLPAQLTFRLGSLATVLLPPIIPKYDWYLTGIVSLLLSICVYIVIDRTRQDVAVAGRQYHHTRRAYDVMFVIAMIGLVMFMTGFFSYKPQAIMSDSMRPVYGRGAMIIVQKTSPIDVSVGDIVQYTMPGHAITHRIVRIEQGEKGQRIFITKGDNSPSEDKPVTGDQIVGIVRGAIPYAGYPSVWLQEAAH